MGTKFLLVATVLCGLTMSAGACAGTSPAIGFGGQMSLQGMTDGVTDAAIQQLEKAADDTIAKLRAEAHARLDEQIKAVKEQLKQQVDELKKKKG